MKKSILSSFAIVAFSLSQSSFATNVNSELAKSFEKNKIVPCISITSIDKSKTCYIENSDYKDISIFLDVKFGINSYTLDNNDKEVIKNFVNIIKGNAEPLIDIYSYSSVEAGKENFKIFNMKLSKKRSEAVKNYMVELGLNSNYISTFAESTNNPLFANDTKEKREANRRSVTEVLIQYDGKVVNK